MNTEGMEQGSNHTLDNMAKLDLTRQYLDQHIQEGLTPVLLEQNSNISESFT